MRILHRLIAKAFTSYTPHVHARSRTAYTHLGANLLADMEAELDAWEPNPELLAKLRHPAGKHHD